VVDTRTPEQRRRIMAAVRSTDTGPELQLRRALYSAGIRGWRCHYKRVPGRPDLAWPALQVAVFVDGAFWHGHPSRHRHGRSGAYWDEKIARNVERDRQADAELAHSGWTVVRVWDFEVARELPAVVERIKGALRERAREGVEWQRLLADEYRAAGKRAGAFEQYEEGPGAFGRKLREARLRAGFSRRDLAAISGIDESAIRLYELGTREPRAGTIARLMTALAR
jgi:DNA mismatch endonuclease, patch repair protein